MTGSRHPRYRGRPFTLVAFPEKKKKNTTEGVGDQPRRNTLTCERYKLDSYQTLRLFNLLQKSQSPNTLPKVTLTPRSFSLLSVITCSSVWEQAGTRQINQYRQI